MSVSIKRIAAQLNISASTVSRALNNKYGVKPETRKRVLEAAAALGYVPNMMARELVSGKSRLVGIILPEIETEKSPPLFGIMPEVNRVLTQHGFETIVHFFPSEAYRVGDLEQFCRRRSIEGILILPGVSGTHPIWQEAVDSQIPCVVMTEEVLGPHCSSMGTDEYPAYRQVVAHLATLGHKHIGFINGPSSVTLCQQRLAGFQSALGEMGLPIRSDYVQYTDFSGTEGAESAWSLKQTSPQVTAICFASDMMALSAMYHFERRGLSIPNDISMVGYDNIYVTALIKPALTTISSHSMGTAMAELLLEMLDGKPGRRQRYAAQLVTRESVSTVPKADG